MPRRAPSGALFLWVCDLSNTRFFGLIPSLKQDRILPQISPRLCVTYALGVTDSTRILKVLVYSDNAKVRTTVKTALGRRPSEDISDVQIYDVATHPALIKVMDTKSFDLLILDGETSPAGGLGLSRQLKDEIYNCPPILVLVARLDDRWLATWSRADAVVAHPIDPRALVKAVLNLLKPASPIAHQAISK